MIKMRFYYQQPILYMHLNIIHVFIFCMYKSMSFYNITNSARLDVRDRVTLSDCESVWLAFNSDLYIN